MSFNLFYCPTDNTIDKPVGQYKTIVTRKAYCTI